MGFKMRKTLIVAWALGATLAFTGCTGSKTGPETAASQSSVETTKSESGTEDELEKAGDEAEAQAARERSQDSTSDELEIKGDLEEAKRMRGSESKPNIADWRRPETYVKAAEGPEAIAAALGQSLEITPENATSVKQQVVDEISAIEIFFDGIKSQIEPEARSQFLGEMQSLGRSIDMQASGTKESLAQVLKEARVDAKRMADQLVKINAGISDDFLIIPGERFGAIDRDSTQESIVAHYGEANYKQEERLVAADYTATVGVLFPGQKQKELLIIWKPDAPGKQISMLKVPEGVEESHWKTVDGLGLGTTIYTAGKINGKPFELIGMEQEHAGSVTDWKGGRLQGLTVSLSAPVTEERFNHLKADKITSESELVGVLNPRVYSLGLSF